MKIAVCYPGGIEAAWSVSDGITNTLRRMRHTVVDIPVGRPGSAGFQVREINGCDLIIVTGLEHFQRNPAFGFNLEAWNALKPPKFAWYHESFFRDDVTFNFRDLETLADEHFFPAVQDAEMFNATHFNAKGRCHWMPFGVDTEVFRPESCRACGIKFSLGQDSTVFAERNSAVSGCPECAGTGWGQNIKTLPIGFIGLLYEERQAFIRALTPHVKSPAVRITIGNVVVKDMDGLDHKATVERLAANYRKIKLFLNLPAKSRLLVTKVYEVMACGTALMTPLLPRDSAKNTEIFTDKKHLLYYQKNHVGGVNQILEKYVQDDIAREVIAVAGCREVHEKHSLKVRMEEMLGIFSRREAQRSVTV